VLLHAAAHRGVRTAPAAALVTVLALALPGAGLAQEEAREPHLILTSSEQRQGLLILSKADTDHGWKFGEFEDTIDALPAGPDRDRQRVYFDALRTLAAFVQHGIASRSSSGWCAWGTWTSARATSTT
jgi:hypothetical protein